MAASKAKSVSVTPLRDKLRQAAKDSGMTQEEIGLRMGFGKGSARKAVSRLLNAGNDYDPRLSTLLSFARALSRPLRDLI